MGWHGDDVTSLAPRAGMTRSVLSKGLARGLTPDQLRAVADVYHLDAMDLALGRVPDLRGATREYASAR